MSKSALSSSLCSTCTITSWVFADMTISHSIFIQAEWKSIVLKKVYWNSSIILLTPMSWKEIKVTTTNRFIREPYTFSATSTDIQMTRWPIWCSILNSEKLNMIDLTVFWVFRPGCSMLEPQPLTLRYWRMQHISSDTGPSIKFRLWLSERPTQLHSLISTTFFTSLSSTETS